MKKSPLKRRTPLKAKPFAKSSWKKGKKTLQGSGLKQRKNVGKGASLKSRSKKRDIQNREYSKLKAQFLSDNPRCAVFPHLWASECHHSKGRLGRLLCDVRWWVPVSREGHDWIESHHRDAREKFWNGVPWMCAPASFNTYVK